MYFLLELHLSTGIIKVVNNDNIKTTQSNIKKIEVGGFTVKGGNLIHLCLLPLLGQPKNLQDLRSLNLYYQTRCYK